MTGSRRVRAPRLSAGRLLGWVFSVALLVAVLIPFVWTLLSSLKTTADITSPALSILPREWMFGNYRRAYEFSTFGNYVLNSFLCAACVMVLGTLFASMAAFGFARVRFFGRNALFYLYILTQSVPFTVLFIPMYIMMQKMRLIDSYLGVILPLLSFPMGTFLMRQAMLAIPMDYEFAARIDGCGRFQTYARIFLPMCRNSVLSLAFFSFMMSWNNYIWPMVILSDNAKYTLPLGLTLYNIERSASGKPDWGVVLAATIMALLPVMAVYLLFSEKFISGVTLGGIKG